MWVDNHCSSIGCVTILHYFARSLFWIVGFEFWILPNLWSDDVSIIEAFKPAYTWAKGSGNVSVRVSMHLYIFVAEVIHSRLMYMMYTYSISRLSLLLLQVLYRVISIHCMLVFRCCCCRRCTA